MIYRLRELNSFSNPAAAKLLESGYSKSVLEVHRDSVETAFINYENTGGVLYLTCNDRPSWIPRWDQVILSRNPFRPGKTLPWKLAGDTKTNLGDLYRIKYSILNWVRS